MLHELKPDRFARVRHGSCERLYHFRWLLPHSHSDRLDDIKVLHVDRDAGLRDKKALANARSLCAELLKDYLGIASAEHPQFNIRLDMNCVRNDLGGRDSDVHDAIAIGECECCFVVNANTGAQAMRFEIEQALNDEWHTDIWRSPKQLLGTQRYVFAGVEYWAGGDHHCGGDDDALTVGVSVVWAA